MSKEMIAIVVALILQGAVAVYWGGSLQSTVNHHVALEAHGEVLERVSRVEASSDQVDERLERIEDKLDRLIRETNRPSPPGR